jgi:hypothetical protein
MRNFAQWVHKSAPGRKYTYFEGVNTSEATMEEEERCRAAFRWALEGKVLLVQKLVVEDGKRHFAYQAIRASKNVPGCLIPAPIQTEIGA